MLLILGRESLAGNVDQPWPDIGFRHLAPSRNQPRERLGNQSRWVHALTLVTDIRPQPWCDSQQISHSLRTWKVEPHDTRDLSCYTRRSLLQVSSPQSGWQLIFPQFSIKQDSWLPFCLPVWCTVCILHNLNHKFQKWSSFTSFLLSKFRLFFLYLLVRPSCFIVCPIDWALWNISNNTSELLFVPSWIDRSNQCMCIGTRPLHRLFYKNYM